LRFQRTQISSQHQITIPSVPFRKAGLAPGDRLHARADGPGRVTLERLETQGSPS
jgi:bifunctional DNA-binding transcriptional regulator/antitoxin component of YhaV-PrlF toxin-antitoxin module